MKYTYLNKFFHCFYGTNKYIFSTFTLSDLHGKILETVFDIRGDVSPLRHRHMVRSIRMSIPGDTSARKRCYLAVFFRYRTYK